MHLRVQYGSSSRVGEHNELGIGNFANPIKGLWLQYQQLEFRACLIFEESTANLSTGYDEDSNITSETRKSLKS